jgi:predicted extracellular nuclease
MLPIYAIQGSGFTSPHEGERVTTRGIVTRVAPRGRGFYVQDPVGDGNPATSDGIFVSRPRGDTVRVGDEVEVTGVVGEEQAKYSPPGAQPITEIGDAQVRVLSSGNPLPAAVLIGRGGRAIPSHDPQETARFWESLEGMRVRVDNGLAIAPSNLFGDYSILPDRGQGVAERTPHGGVLPGNGHNRYERVSVKVWREFHQPMVNVGDALRAIEGVVSYRSGDYQIFATREPEVVPAPRPARPETTSLVGTATQVTVASYNVLNLDPKVEDRDLVDSRRAVDDDVGTGRFEALGRQIAHNLRAPDIIALQEVQDNNGTEPGPVVDASETYETLIAAIRRAGGPEYAWCEIPPEPDADGGQPGGNIRNGYLYRPDRVSLVPGSLERLGTEGHTFDACRKPLVARFRFRGRELTVVNNHLSSRRGSTPWNGTVQPPLVGRAEERLAQAELLRAWMERFAAAEPDTDLLVCGDFNTFEDAPPLEHLAAYPFVNTAVSLPEGERYDYNFRGVSQLLGHTVVKESMLARTETDVVHVNSDFADKASDHDPTVIRVRMLPSVVS